MHQKTWFAWEIISRRRAVSLAASVSREMDLSLDTDNDDDDDDDDDDVRTIAIGVVCVVEVHFSICHDTSCDSGERSQIDQYQHWLILVTNIK